MCLSNVFIMPSYREGFGTSVIEAAACGLPTIASNIYGLNDAVVNHETGILFQVKNYKKLSDKMKFFIMIEIYVMSMVKCIKKSKIFSLKNK